MSEILESKTTTKGHKNVTSQLIDTPFGQLKVSIGVSGYKSSEGGEIFPPPSEIHESDSAEERAEGSE